MTHEELILQSRTGGFGGSDADIFYRVGKNGLGALTATDKKRIAVAKGLRQVESFSNQHTEAGHDFESYCAQRLLYTDREHLLQRDMSLHFATFAHADFYNRDSNSVFECKYVQRDTPSVIKTYQSQLQWYYLLGVNTVNLVHGRGDARLDDVTINIVTIDRDDAYIALMQEGIRILSDNYESLDVIEHAASVETIALSARLAELRMQIDALTADYDALKTELLFAMQSESVCKIDADRYAVTCTPQSQVTIFDYKKLLAEHPEYDVDVYKKTTTRNATLTIKSK